MAEKNISQREALNQALFHEMERDPMVIIMGEDIVGGAGKADQFTDAWGGPFGVTHDLVHKFGKERVRDTPITESAFVGAAITASATGLRPIAELMFVDFATVAMDMIVNQAAKMRYMFGGKLKLPFVIRTTVGGGIHTAAQHSQVLYSIFAHIPGIKIVVPSTPYDCKGLLITAIRDDDPVMFFENKVLYDEKGMVPEEAYTIPFGEADIKREGDDVTIVALSGMVNVALDAAKELEKGGISVEIVDPRTLVPMDEQTILKSVEKTGRVVIVDEDSPRCGAATDIAALIGEKAFFSLEAPIMRVTPPHTPVPFSPPLEEFYLPNAKKVIKAVKEIA